MIKYDKITNMIKLQILQILLICPSMITLTTLI